MGRGPSLSLLTQSARIGLESPPPPRSREGRGPPEPLSSEGAALKQGSLFCPPPFLLLGGNWLSPPSLVAPPQLHPRKKSLFPFYSPFFPKGSWTFWPFSFSSPENLFLLIQEASLVPVNGESFFQEEGNVFQGGEKNSRHSGCFFRGWGGIIFGRTGGWGLSGDVEALVVWAAVSRAAPSPPLELCGHQGPPGLPFPQAPSSSPSLPSNLKLWTWRGGQNRLGCRS